MKIFARNEGLAKLVELLYDHYKKANKADKKEASQASKKRKWLRELKAQIQVDGYAAHFMANTNCRQLLFRAMKGVKDTEDSMVTQIPKNILENPLEPLYSTLFQLYADSKETLDSDKIMKQSVDAGVLHLILNRLTMLCAVEHRDPEKFVGRSKRRREQLSKDEADRKERAAKEAAKKKDEPSTGKKKNGDRQEFLGQRNRIWYIGR